MPYIPAQDTSYVCSLNLAAFIQFHLVFHKYVDRLTTEAEIQHLFSYGSKKYDRPVCSLKTVVTLPCVCLQSADK